MSRPTLLILSLGELGTSLLEAVARADLFDTIIVASRDRKKAQARANNAAIGAGLEGLFPNIRSEELDFNDLGFALKLREISPDYIFTAPSLMPWWQTDNKGIELPFAAFTSLHLSLMSTLRASMAQADCNAVWIGASYPDVINPVLNRTGFGPTCGIGNVQEPLPKIQSFVAAKMGCHARDVKVQMVAQHAFEYHVLNAKAASELPPYLLRATVGDRDVTDIATEALFQPFDFPYDLHFNRVTASAGVQALRALTSDTPIDTHLPGIGILVGGYPVTCCNGQFEITLPSAWSLDHAVAINKASLPWDGISEVTSDGTIVYSDTTLAALHALLGKAPDMLTPENAQAQAQALLSAISG